MSLRGRFLLLIGLRWLSTGLLMPVSLLLPLARGLTVAELGLVISAQGVVVLLCEVPSGALTDAWGRRPVLIASTVVAFAGYALFLVADSVAGFAAAWAVMGVYRALDSGPLESWFVDAENARDAADEVPRGLAAAGGVTSSAIAVGSLAAAGFLKASPWGAEASLAAPYAAAMVVVLVQAICAWRLMEATPRAAGDALGAWGASLRSGVGVALGPRMRLLTVAMVAVGIGVGALELFMPVRLAEFTPTGADAASILGVVTAAAWGLAALGAALTSRLLRAWSPHVLAPTLFAIEGLGLVAMAAATGVGVLVAGYWLCYLVHTSSGAMYNSLVHERVADAQRGTALSVTSMAFLGSGAVGGVALGALADGTSASVALLVGAASMGAAALSTTGAVQPQR